jgi:universal stress protein E
MREPKRILAVVDPTATSQPACERAATLARSIGARLELFIYEYVPQLADSAAHEFQNGAWSRSALIDDRLNRLRELRRALAADGADIAIDARWDSPLADGIVRKVLDSSADIVFKDTHYHPFLKRSVFSNTDWTLIRDCPALLWLAKPAAIEAKPRFIAAVDPLHERAKPTELDDRIMSAAKQLCYPLNGELHVFHAFDATPALVTPMDSMAPPLPIRAISDAMRAQHTAAVHELTDAHGIRRESVHIAEGNTRERLIDLAESLHADVAVMGAVSRRGLKRLFLGNTAEDVLDKLPCDLLIVKPANFETSVPR